MIEGKFFVLEGIDGAGTTTHTKLLTSALKSDGLAVHATREPSDGPIGMMLRQVLAGRLVVPGLRGPRPPSWTTMALLFAADRVDHVDAEVLPNLLDGVTVISDRYDHSSVAYQSMTAGGDPEAVAWISKLNAYARRPDLTIVLDIPPDVAASRRLTRGAGKQLYEDDALQRELVSFYRNIERHFPRDRVVHVDADRPVGDVAADILQHVRAHRAGEH